MPRFDMDECEIEEETGHLLCPKPEEMDFKALECSPQNDIEGDGVTTKNRNASASDQIEVV